jgi:cytochrome c-type biogenesis protein CcmH
VGIGAALLVALIFLAIGSDHPPPSSAAGRIAHLEATLKCPSCEDLSIGQSQNPIARRLDAIVTSDVHAGMSDQAITSAILTEFPGATLVPTGGLGLALIVLPSAAIVIGAFVLALVLRARRRAPELREGDEELVARARTTAEVGQ